MRFWPVFPVVLSLPVRALACDLAIAFAVDVSGSVDPRDYDIQMQGLADALRDGIIAQALGQGEAAVMLVQWTGTSRQSVTVPWTRITGAGEIEALAQRIETAPRAWRNFATAVGEALAFTTAEFAAVPDCSRRVIDVSGDGSSNEGIAPTELHADLRRLGIVVNGLAIEETEADLTAWYWENVIVGEGAFVVTADRFADYPRAIRRKLLREAAKQTAWLEPQN